MEALFITPFVEIVDSPIFFMEVVINGMLTGILYSLVALGYVLIFKASGVFNFAQGAMVLFAPLTLVGLMETGVPFPIAFILTILVMIALAMLIEWSMLRRLVNQDGMILFMATIGLSFVLEGSSQIIWGLLIGIGNDRLKIATLLRRCGEFDFSVCAFKKFRRVCISSGAVFDCNDHDVFPYP